MRSLAKAAGVAASTVHRIERGDLQPTVQTLSRIAEAAGVRLRMEPEVDYAVSLVGLARSIRADRTKRKDTIRKAAEFVSRFNRADPDTRSRMIAAEPPAVGDPHWDAFVAGLAEWLAVRAEMPTPAWTHKPERYLDHGWWITPMASMRAWEYAGSPVSFQSRGIYIHRDSLVNV